MRGQFLCGLTDRENLQRTRLFVRFVANFTRHPNTRWLWHMMGIERCLHTPVVFKIADKVNGQKMRV